MREKGERRRRRAFFALVFFFVTVYGGLHLHRPPLTTYRLPEPCERIKGDGCSTPLGGRVK